MRWSYRSRSLLVGVAFVCFVLTAAWHALAQEPSAAPTSSQPAPPSASAKVVAPAPVATTPPPVAKKPLPFLDRSTPRQCVIGFMRAADRDDYDSAVRYLDLRGLRWGEQTPEEAARVLHDVLERHVWIDQGAISDAPDGPEAGAVLREQIATLDLDGQEIPIVVERVSQGGQQLWLFSPGTVSRMPELEGAFNTSSVVRDLLPEGMQSGRWFGLWTWQWLGLALCFIVGFPVGLGLGTLLSRLLKRVAASTKSHWDDAVVEGTRGVLRFAMGWVVLRVAIETLDLPSKIGASIRTAIAIPLILATGYMLIRALRLSIEVYLDSVPDDQEMNTRGLRTQLVILRKLATALIMLVSVAIALMQFEVVRTVGWSLLASAGVLGVALGFAAQRSLGAVVAGLQLSLTQPVRLGDALVVQGEFGEVEEITLTYIRLKLWDERRLIVPADKFLTDIFENWSKPGDGLIGVIMLPVDLAAPVDRIRAKLEELATAHPFHDGREVLLQVFELREQSMLLRIRVSTDEFSKALPMRCDLREQLMAWLRELDGGRYLPRQRLLRGELDRTDSVG